MATRWPFRTKVTTTTTGTGSYTATETGLASWRTLTRAVADGDLASGDTVNYIVVDTNVTNGPNLLEVSSGVWDNTAKTLTRATVHQPNGTAVNWGAGTRDLFVIDNPILFALLAGAEFSGLLKVLISGSIITPAVETGLLVQRSATAGTDVGLSLVSGTTGKARVNLGDTGDEKDGAWIYDNNLRRLIGRAAAVDGSYLDSGGVWKTAAGLTYAMVGANDSFASTTGQPFKQAAAPTGWTKSTTDNDAALRVVSGTPGASGGTLGVSAATTGGHSLSETELAVHSHPPFGSDVGIEHLTASSGGTVALASGTQVWNARSTTGTAGSGASHAHPLALKYVDCIVCTKN